jgi:Txe/YoeB family toxin of Txe-Axe toxin-antitoxin module
LKNLKKIIEDTQRNGTEGLGHPEALSDNLAGWKWLKLWNAKHITGINEKR